MSGSAISREIRRLTRRAWGGLPWWIRRVGHRKHIRRYGSQAVETVGRQQWLDRPSYRFEHALTLVFAALGRRRERVTNVLHGTWLGHPLHPALTAVPTGAIATAVTLDAASVLPGQSAMRDAARLALGVGIVGSLGAAVTGATDWQHTHGQDRRIGIVHGLLNTVATGLYAVSWWDRRRGRAFRGMAGSALGYGLTMASGYLGGCAGVWVRGRRGSLGSPIGGRRLDTGAGGDGAERPAPAGADRRRRCGLASRRRDRAGRRRVLSAPGRADVGRLGRPRPGGMPVARFTIRMSIRSGTEGAGHLVAAELSDPHSRRNRRGARLGSGDAMNGFEVLFDHHNTLRGLCKKITAMPPTSHERQDTPR